MSKITMISVFTISIMSLAGCTPSTPVECDGQNVKDSLVDSIKKDLATKTYMLTRESVSPDELKLNVESIKTISKDDANPFYRKCEISFTMPGMMFSVNKVYVIDKNESGDITVKFTN